jgi:uroporphyrinogen decarboxylase
LDVAWERVGLGAAVQGNLDPAACLGPWDVVEAKAADELRRAAGRAGHVFNLGHGVLPETPHETMERLVEFVHERTAREGA